MSLHKSSCRRQLLLLELLKDAEYFPTILLLVALSKSNYETFENSGVAPGPVAAYYHYLKKTSFPLYLVLGTRPNIAVSLTE